MNAVIGLLPVVLLAAGVPLYLLLLAASEVAVLSKPAISLSQLHVVFFGGVDNYVLLAVPVFLFAREGMGTGGGSRRLVDWMLSALGRTRGGLGLATLGASTLFGSISGSSAATVATMGKLMYQPLRDARYGDRFSSAAVTSSGAIDSVIPPSIPMILFAAVAQQPVGELFLSGVGPALVMCGLTAVYIIWFAGRHEVAAGEAFSLRRFVRATRDGFWSLLAPVVVLGGIYGGIFAPTEAAAIACAYACLLSVVLYREMGWRELLECAVRSVRMTSQVMVIVAAAGVFSWVLTISGIGPALVSFVRELAPAPWLLLLVINLILLPVGCILEPGSAILILTPLLMPMIQAAGIDPVHFGIVVVVNVSVGLFIPPVGMNIFVAQAMLRPHLPSLFRGLMPFLAIDLVALAVTTYVPPVSVGLARWLLH